MKVLAVGSVGGSTQNIVVMYMYIVRTCVVYHTAYVSLGR